MVAIGQGLRLLVSDESERASERAEKSCKIPTASRRPTRKLVCQSGRGALEIATRALKRAGTWPPAWPSVCQCCRSGFGGGATCSGGGEAARLASWRRLDGRATRAHKVTLAIKSAGPRAHLLLGRAGCSKASARLLVVRAHRRRLEGVKESERERERRKLKKMNVSVVVNRKLANILLTWRASVLSCRSR